MHWQADAVEAVRGQEMDVLAADEVSQPEFVELVAVRLANQLRDSRFDGVLCAFVTNAEHVAFLQHPAAQAHPPQDNLLSLAIHDLRILRPKKTVRLSLRETCGQAKQPTQLRE